jgi:hypothetical protein
MRSLLSLALGTALVLTFGFGSTLAAQPEQIRETGTFQLAPDYCDTGVTLDVAFWSVRTVFWDGEDVVKVTYSTKYVVTRIGSDEVMIRTESGQVAFKIVPETNGGYAIVSSGRGLPELIKSEHGRVLLRDAGEIVTVDHFDADGNFLGSDITIHGPHPDFDSDSAAQCDATKEALGL